MTVMLAAALGPSAQLVFRRPAPVLSLSPPRGFLIGRGLLAARQFEPPSVLERLGAESFGTLVGPEVFMPVLGLIGAEELVVVLVQPTELLAHELRQPPSSLAEKRPVIHTRRQPPSLEPDVQPFVMALRTLIETEQLTVARQMLNAAPAYILSDPLVAKLRSVLAPPVVKKVDKRDVDRSREYEWLKTEGHKYRGRWVALEDNRLLASAATLRELRETLRTMTLTRLPLIHRVD